MNRPLIIIIIVIVVIIKIIKDIIISIKDIIISITYAPSPQTGRGLVRGLSLPGGLKAQPR